MKREGKVDFRNIPDKPNSQQNQLKWDGKGKRALDHWVAIVKPEPLCLKSTVPAETAKEALRLAAQKLPVLTSFVTRPDYAE